MALFGRRTARRRLQSAARQSLAVPAFSAPVDCTAWVLGGLWPAELAAATPETATLAEYLSADLHRIASSANEQLRALARSGSAGPGRQAAEARVVNVARAFAVLRVESTMRQLHNEALDLPTRFLSLGQGPVGTETTGHIRVGTGAPAPPAPAAPAPPPPRPEPAPPAPGASPEPPSPVPEVEVLVPGGLHSGNPDPVLIEPVEATVPEVEVFAEDLVVPEPVADVGHPAEPTEQRLRRLLAFVARQEPGVRWAAGARADGAVVLATDIAHGWIPPGVELPAEVVLVEPGWRDGGAAALLGETIAAETYAPGDRIGWSSESGPVEAARTPRTLPMVDDLGWVLAEATHWRDGLPRIVNTLAKAGAAGTGVADAEVDLLRVHLDTVRYQLLAQYPDADPALVLNCMLLAATDAIATGDDIGANYHFVWFQTLSNPPVGSWGRRP